MKDVLPVDYSMATLWQIIVKLLELHGLDARRMLVLIGVSPETLKDNHARLPSHLYDGLFQKASERITDPSWGLRAAECWHPSHLGVMGYAWLSCSTLSAGLKRMERCSRLLGSDFTYTVEEKADGLHFSHDPWRAGNGPLGWIYADFTLSIIMDMCRQNRGSQLDASYVTLKRPLPPNAGAWERYFGCEVRFGRESNTLVLRLEDANEPLPTANAELAVAFDTLLKRQLSELSGTDLPNRVKTLLVKELTSGNPSAARVSTALAMSERGMHRKLAQHETSFQALLDQARYELAKKYLLESTKSATEITFLLGFSEPSAFTRAFRRWTGLAPMTFKANQGNSR